MGNLSPADLMTYAALAFGALLILATLFKYLSGRSDWKLVGTGGLLGGLLLGFAGFQSIAFEAGGASISLERMERLEDNTAELAGLTSETVDELTSGYAQLVEDFTSQSVSLASAEARIEALEEELKAVNTVAAEAARSAARANGEPSPSAPARLVLNAPETLSPAQVTSVLQKARSDGLSEITADWLVDQGIRADLRLAEQISTAYQAQSAQIADLEVQSKAFNTRVNDLQARIKGGQ